MKTIPIFKPYVGEQELEAIKEVLESGWMALGPKTAEFEDRFSKYLGVSGAVALNSCTASLDLAVRLAGIGPGDEVIVPAITFVSTAHAVVYSGATPVFADVDYDTLCISIDSVKNKITPKTKAVIPVHYGGRPVDFDALKEVCGNIKIIEDCAHAAGSVYKNKKVGTLGDFSCFSFHAVKNMTTGDGGALICKNEKDSKSAHRLRWLGIDKSTWGRVEGKNTYSWDYRVPDIGFKCHMNDIAAALGIVQLGKLDDMNARRRELAEIYTHNFTGHDSIITPVEDGEDYRSSWHIYCIKCEKRNELAEYLKNKGIHTGVHYRPIHKYSCYGLDAPELEVAESVFESILSLPIYPGLSDVEHEYIIDSVIGFYE